MPERTFDRARFRTVRRASEMTQEQIAGEMGVQESVVNRWEGGGITPPAEKLPKLAALVGLPLARLAPREGFPDLADLRCDAGFSQGETAAVIGTSSPSPVRKAEGGVRRLSKRFEEPLACAYGVSVEELRAAQERSFGNEVPADVARLPDREPLADLGMPQTTAEKITYLLDRTYEAAGRPSDGELAWLANEAAGGPLLTEDLVRALRTGEQPAAEPEVLDALADALDVPPVFFRSNDREVARIVARIKSVRSDFEVMAARGGEEGVPPELLEFVNAAFADILGGGRPAGRPTGRGH